MADFDSEFFGLVFPGFQATEKIHAQKSRPELSAFLSNFTFLNPKFIHGDFLLTGEAKELRWGRRNPESEPNRPEKERESGLGASTETPP